MSIARIGGLLGWVRRGHSGTAALAQTTLTQFLILGTNLATGVLTARALAPSGRGELAAIILVPSLLGFLSTLGIPSALIYHMKRHPADQQGLVGAALLINMFTGAIFVGIGYVALPLVLHQYSADVINVARWFLLTIPMALLYTTCASVFEASNNFWYSNSSRVLSPLLTFALLVGLLLDRRLDAVSAAVAYSIPSLPIAVKVILDVVKRHHPQLPAVPVIYRRLLGYGLRFYGVDVLRVVGQQVDQILVVAFLSPAKMGLYVVALSVASVLGILQASISRVLLPRIAARPLAEVVERVGRATRVSCSLTLLLTVLIVALGPELLHLFYGSRFESGTGLLRLLAVEALVSATALGLMQTFAAVGKPGLIAMFQGAGVALTVPLLILLIPRLGLVGAGLALLTSSTIRLCLIMGSYPVLLHVPAPRVIMMLDDVTAIKERLTAFRGRSPDPAS